MAVQGVFGHRVNAGVGAGQSARNGDSHRRAVGAGRLDLAGLGIDGLDLAQRHVPNQLIAPPAVAEDAVCLVNDGVAFEVVEDPASAPLALGDQRGVDGLPQGVGDCGRQPVPEQLVPVDDGGVVVRPVAVPGDYGGVLVDAVVASVPVHHVCLLLVVSFL